MSSESYIRTKRFRPIYTTHLGVEIAEIDRFEKSSMWRLKFSKSVITKEAKNIPAIKSYINLCLL
jgi:hypothetical protein